ncbi:MAG: MATE family efflux transporter, partial [Oscillospiraceae bacterium]|nr:MATE family efflux transporter [Oscillospiraceae bacterium]
ILPWGLNMGAAGAGLATFLSNCAACIYFFVLLFVRRGKTYVCVSPSLLPNSGKILLGICAVGVPASIQNLLNVTSMTVLNNFTAAFKDADAIAAIGIVQKINMIPLQVTFGLSQGIMPLISYNYASGNVDRMKQTLIFNLKIAAVFLAVVTTGYYVGAGSLVALFMDNPAVVGYGTRFLRGLCLCLPFLCLDFLAVGLFQACGLGKYALLFAILRKIVLEIPALYILNHLVPLYGLAYAQPVTELVLAVTAVAMLLHLFRRMYAEGTPLTFGRR